ncbi:MAG: hypothetical protein U1F43_32955 [Myxococcota bacterium]
MSFRSRVVIQRVWAHGMTMSVVPPVASLWSMPRRSASTNSASESLRPVAASGVRLREKTWPSSVLPWPSSKGPMGKSLLPLRNPACPEWQPWQSATALMR